jgi:hypothetical protein
MSNLEQSYGPGVQLPALLRYVWPSRYVVDYIMFFGTYYESEVDVSFHDEFDSEFGALSEAVQDEMLAHARLLEQFGPLLGRPRVDTLKGSRHANMKELRFDADDGV